MHVKGYAAPEAKAAAEQARQLIEKAQALGEEPEDPLLLFSVIHGVTVAHFVAFNGDALRELAGQFLALAEKHGAKVPLMIAHRQMGHFLLGIGNFVESRAHYKKSLTLYDPGERQLGMRFGGVDARVSALCWRSLALWSLGYPAGALADCDQALRGAREIDQAATLMNTLVLTGITRVLCRNCATANAQLNELAVLADEKGAVFWKAWGLALQGVLSASADKTAEAVQMITSALTAWRSTGANWNVPWLLSNLGIAHATLGNFHEAWRCIGEAMTMVKETKQLGWDPEVNRIAGEIALMQPKPDAAKAQPYFEHAFAVARQQQAKSWELRAAMSLARLWRDHGKPEQARELLAPVYGWFTEGFDTRDLKDAKALLEELAT